MTTRPRDDDGPRSARDENPPHANAVDRGEAREIEPGRDAPPGRVPKIPVEGEAPRLEREAAHATAADVEQVKCGGARDRAGQADVGDGRARHRRLEARSR